MDYEARAEQDRKNRAERVAQVTRPRVEAMVAAKWWADTLRNPGIPDTGDSRNDGFMFALSEKDPFNESMIASFEAELAAGIEAELVGREERHSVHMGAVDPVYKWHWYLSIHCDYHPDTLLCEAAERAGLEHYDSALPCKTDMYIDRGKIETSKGYGACREVVWSSVDGANYWASKAMVACRDVLAGLANGVVGNSQMLAADMFAQAVVIDLARPQGYDDELPQEAAQGQRGLGAFITGLGMAMEIAVAVRVTQMQKSPRSRSSGGRRRGA